MVALALLDERTNMRGESSMQPYLILIECSYEPTTKQDESTQATDDAGLQPAKLLAPGRYPRSYPRDRQGGTRLDERNR
jgi:hypothetical protein